MEKYDLCTIVIIMNMNKLNVKYNLTAMLSELPRCDVDTHLKCLQWMGS